MKEFLKKIILFLLLTPLAYLFFIACIVLFFPEAKTSMTINYKQTTGHSHSRFQEVMHVKNIDILFIGPSTTYMGFDPRIFEKAGFSVFNLGSSAQTPRQTYILLNRFLDHLNPKNIVYNPHPGTFIIDGFESTTDLISNLSVGKDTFKLAVDSKNLQAINTFLFKFFVDFFNTEEDYNEPKVIGIDTYIDRGYVTRSGIVAPKDVRESNSFKRTQEWDPLQFQLDYFEKNINMIKKRNIELLFVIPPVNSNAYEALHFSSLKFQNYIKQFGSFIDYNKHLALNDSLHFYDNTVHLNQAGVYTFNRVIIERGDFKFD